MIDAAKIASILGKTVNDSFKLQLNAAVTELESRLGYSLGGSLVIEEERLFRWDPGKLWQRAHPFYEKPSKVAIVSVNGDERVVSNYQIGQNGNLDADWYNGLKFCDSWIDMFSCFPNRCDHLLIRAKWGFAEPQEESGLEEIDYIPFDLLQVIADIMRYQSPGHGIKSESTGTRNYTKFESSGKSVWDKHADILEFYSYRLPRF